MLRSAAHRRSEPGTGPRGPIRSFVPFFERYGLASECVAYVSLVKTPRPKNAGDAIYYDCLAVYVSRLPNTLGQN